VRRARATCLLGVIALVGVVVVPANAVSGQTGASSGPIRPAALAPDLPRGATRLGALSPTTPIAFDVVLAPSHPQQLASLLNALYDPKSPAYEHWLERGDFQRRFGPNPTEVNAVTGWLHRVGLSRVHRVDGILHVQTTARDASRALGLSLSTYRRADGSQTFAAGQAPLIPAGIVPNVGAIVGLSGTTLLQPHHRILATVAALHANAAAHASSCATSVQQQAASLGGWTTLQTSATYQANRLTNAGLNGNRKTIAIYSLAPHVASDTSAYLRCFGLRNPVSTRPVDGGARADPNGTVEADLDVEDAAATAPGAKIVSYEGPNTEQGSLDVWAAIVHDDAAQVVSTSWGRCEAFASPATRNALHTLFMQAATQGQTIVAAAGDSGSEDCLPGGRTTLAVDSPAGDPFVTAVGGTSLKPNLATSNPDHEPVWNDCVNATDISCAYTGGGAAGGGESHAFARPSWQPIAAGSTCATSCRQVPDVSVNAGVGEAFYSGGHWYLIGGTSIGSPKVAGIAADITSGCATTLGAFNSKLYKLSRQDTNGVAVRDVPAGEGNNDLTRTNASRYQTADGFDLATGLGTPVATGLACPEVARVTPTSAAAGSRVTIYGLALAHATITFGRTPATVLAQGTTSATLIVPKGAGRQQIRASDVIGQGTYGATFTYRKHA
jgi:subtilase family serine protease